MEDVLREKMLDAGVNIETALERFMGNEQLLERFLKKFPQDPNYNALNEFMAAEDYEEAFKAAHTMKGVCGNLSLITLYDIVCAIVEPLRDGDGATAKEKMPQLIEEYTRVVAIIENM